MVSDIFYWIFLILLLGFIIILFLTGIFFLINAIKKKMSNLAILGIGVISFPIGFIGNFIYGLGFIFQEYFVFIGFVCGIIFINLTFYRQKMKKANFILFLVIILGIIQHVLFYLYFPIEINRGFEYYLRVSLDLLYVLLVYDWFAYSFYTAYNRLKSQDIEPWIKARYKMLAISSFIMGFHTIPEFFQPKNVYWGDPDNLISLIIFGILTIMAISYGLIFSISWFMPKWLKRYFNKGYKREAEKEYTEEELMTLIKTQLKKNEIGEKKN